MNKQQQAIADLAEANGMTATVDEPFRYEGPGVYEGEVLGPESGNPRATYAVTHDDGEFVYGRLLGGLPNDPRAVRDAGEDRKWRRSDGCPQGFSFHLRRRLGDLPEPEPFRVTRPGVYECDGSHVYHYEGFVDRGCHVMYPYGDKDQIRLVRDDGTMVNREVRLTRRIGDLPSEEREGFPFCGCGLYTMRSDAIGEFVNYCHRKPSTPIVAPHFNWLDGGNPDTGAVCIWGEGKFAVKAMVCREADGCWVVVFGSPMGDRRLRRRADPDWDEAAAREWAEQQMSAELKRRAVDHA